MPVLADLNRQKRDYAYSGKAGIGDVPWLYGIQAEQAAANQPAGIGQGAGMGGEEAAAPNPQSFGGAVGGGGASGSADTGMLGPGQSGLGEEFDQYYRDYVAREGGQAGEPGGPGAGSVEFGPDQYVDPSLAEWAGWLGPSVVGLVGSAAAAGMRGYNAGLLGDELEAAGYPGLSGWQQAGAAFGMNNYGAGDPRDTYGSLGIGGLAEAGYEAAQGSGNFGGMNDPALGVSANQRARQDTRGGLAAGPSAPSATAAIGRSAAARQAERSSYGGGGAESGAGGTRGAEGKSSADRHGAGNYHDGGFVSEGNDPSQLRGDVQTTLQEGEGVLTADVMDIVGPGFVHGMNAMAKMLRTRR